MSTSKFFSSFEKSRTLSGVVFIDLKFDMVSSLGMKRTNISLTIFGGENIVTIIQFFTYQNKLSLKEW